MCQALATRVKKSCHVPEISTHVGDKCHASGINVMCQGPKHLTGVGVTIRESVPSFTNQCHVTMFSATCLGCHVSMSRVEAACHVSGESALVLTMENSQSYVQAHETVRTML